MSLKPSASPDRYHVVCTTKLKFYIFDPAKKCRRQDAVTEQIK